MLGAWLRRTVYWTLDTLKGSPVRTRKKQLHKLRAERKGNPQALAELLQHACRTVPAYKHIRTPDLETFPVVCKADYRADFDAYRSDLYLDDTQLHKVYTSGSSGTPFMAYQDKDKLLWHRAGLIDLNDRIGWHLGERFLFMRMWKGAHANGRLSQLMSNTVALEVSGFQGEKVAQARCRIQKDKQLKLILGYASAVEILANHILQAGDPLEALGIRLVIADSECLSDSAKAAITKAFGCPVLDRYGNNENGILGITLDSSRTMELNFPEYYVELLKLDSDTPAEPGELGRIVITDLYNKAFPFIRYDTGDVGIAAEMYGSQCLKLASLGGRSASILTTPEGARLGETAVTAYFENVVGIGRWQLAQTGAGEYELRVANTAVQLDETLHRLCLDCFGANAKVTVRHLDTIAQEKNGKYKVILNETT